VACVAFLANAASALPQYRRLFEKKYGYAVSCLLCHQEGGGSALSAYGRDYLIAGTGEAAFAKIGPKDSDGDGVSNTVELEKKSNPTDEASTPEAPGDWLKNVEALALPVDHLKLLFPGVSKFSAVEGSLSPEQVTWIQSQLGTALTPEDTVPTFYFAVSGEGRHAARTGVALFTRGRGPSGGMTVAVAADLSNRVTAVKVLSHAEHKALQEDAFTHQFKGKSLKDPIAVGQDIKAPEGLADAAAKVALNVRKSLLTIQAVFGRRKR